MNHSVKPLPMASRMRCRLQTRCMFASLTNRCPDKTRRRVQNEELLHRGRTNEPLYVARKLLLTAAEKLSPRLAKRLDVMFAYGDPNGQVYEAWMTKELVRDLYTLHGKPADAARWIDSLIDDCRASKVKEVKGLRRVLKQWREPILAWHTTGASNGPAEGLNSIIKKLKRVSDWFSTIRSLPNPHPPRHWRRQLEPPRPRPIMKSH